MVFIIHNFIQNYEIIIKTFVTEVSDRARLSHIKHTFMFDCCVILNFTEDWHYLYIFGVHLFKQLHFLSPCTPTKECTPYI